MPHAMFLILGGGMTADAAVEGIRQAEPNGLIGLISAEPHPPYHPSGSILWSGPCAVALRMSSIAGTAGATAGPWRWEVVPWRSRWNSPALPKRQGFTSRWQVSVPNLARGLP